MDATRRRRITTAERRLKEASLARKARIRALRDRRKTWREIGEIEGISTQRAHQLGRDAGEG